MLENLECFQYTSNSTRQIHTELRPLSVCHFGWEGFVIQYADRETHQRIHGSHQQRVHPGHCLHEELQTRLGWVHHRQRERDDIEIQLATDHSDRLSACGGRRTCI